ncbi:hypothetical protein KYLE_25 [Pantoea phage Kyle]|uniref:Uncharacterized protein n=1 Tax=Pantoea phage Kyle TaxID=2589665 RepID=A0A514A8R8_9CAUD|nr:hypothetical protein HWC52_gp025 [Pantoea phage Kyle]QDH49645.1 hypothetical protein KYLE_25 [Pantoea phage Kyle]
MSQYMSVKKCYFFEADHVPDTIMVSVLCEHGFNRFYFHDQKPGNFVLIIVHPAEGNRVSVDCHYNVSPESEGRSTVEVSAHKLVETIRLMLSTAIASGFGK